MTRSASIVAKTYVIIIIVIMIIVVITMTTTRSMASLFHWLLCCLCISNILLILSNMVESLGALEVAIMMTMVSMTMMTLEMVSTTMMMLEMVSTTMMTMVIIKVEMPGYLILLPAFFVSSHVFLSTTVLITVAITIERYQVVIKCHFIRIKR